MSDGEKSSLGSVVNEAVDAAEKAAEDFARAVPSVAAEVAEKTAALATEAANRSLEELTLWGRAVERGWNYFVGVSNPPWTLKKVLGWTFVTLTLAAVWILYREVRLGVLSLPLLADGATAFLNWAANLGPVGLFLVTAVATLFFFFIPSEPYYVLALSAASNLAVPIGAAALGSTVGACANFYFGRGFRQAQIKKKGDRAKVSKWGRRAETKWGTVFLFLAMALPFPEVVAVGYGASKYPFRRFVLVTTPARFVKFTWVALAFIYLNASF